jgi:Tfp pilus assembly protein PilX
MRTPRLNDERGMALAVAIFALVVIGALVAGVFFTGQLEQQIGGSSRYAAEAAQAAEAGTSAVLADWDSYSLNNSTVGGTTAIGTFKVNKKTNYSTSVRRLNTELFLVTTTGNRTNASGTVLSQRTVGNLVRLLYANANARAAVTVTKPITFNGNAFAISGNDTIPDGWGKDSLGNADPNCTDGADQAGIRSASTTGANKGDLTKIDGNPETVDNDTTVNTNFFNVFGDVTFDELKKQADIVISASTPQQPTPTLMAAAPFRCNVGDDNNWGEPRRSAGYIKACSTYFPIIYASGSQLKLSAGSRGQGLLLVEGDLEIVGGFEFAGLIVAKGGIKMAGTGNKVTGALLAQNVAIDDKNTVSGNTSLMFSSCAVNKAVQGSANASPLANRSWVQLYQ